MGHVGPIMAQGYPISTRSLDEILGY